MYFVNLSLKDGEYILINLDNVTYIEYPEGNSSVPVVHFIGGKKQFERVSSAAFEKLLKDLPVHKL